MNKKRFDVCLYFIRCSPRVDISVVAIISIIVIISILSALGGMEEYILIKKVLLKDSFYIKVLNMLRRAVYTAEVDALHAGKIPDILQEML